MERKLKKRGGGFVALYRFKSQWELKHRFKEGKGVVSYKTEIK